MKRRGKTIEKSVALLAVALCTLMATGGVQATLLSRLTRLRRNIK